MLNRKHRIEQQHTLLRPRQQTPVLRGGYAKVPLNFFINILQGGRFWHTGRH